LPAPDFTHNKVADANREAKAKALARWCYDQHQTPPTDPAARRAAERAAGIGRASEETWEQAADWLAKRQAWDARQAGMAPQAVTRVEAIAAGARLRPSRVRDDRGCGHWIGAELRFCEATPTREYLTGHKCADHTPNRLAALAETVVDWDLTLESLRAAAGLLPTAASAIRTEEYRAARDTQADRRRRGASA
jgi:hypothetical protein